jgi:hypothetical protein
MRIAARDSDTGRRIYAAGFASRSGLFREVVSALMSRRTRLIIDQIQNTPLGQITRTLRGSFCA